MAVKYHDYYKTLGIERDSTQEQIQAAYRKLARTYHPDVNKAAGAEKKFKEITEAYEVLKDPKKRKRYDTLGENWQAGEDFRPPPGWEGFSGRPRAGGFNQSFQFKGFDGDESFDFFSGGFSDFFQSIFGGSGGGFSADPTAGRAGFGTANRTGPRAGRTHGGTAGPNGNVSADDDHEAEITLTLEEAYAGGKRTLMLTIDEPGPGGRMERRQKSFEVTIPPGIQDGKRLRLAGQGGRRMDGSAGDLYLRTRISPHPRFRINGADLETDLPVTPWEAALGAKVEARLVDGSATVSVTAGSQSGKRLRLKGKGLKKEGADRGDLYLMIKIVVPERLTPDESELFGKLKDISSFNPRKS